MLDLIHWMHTVSSLVFEGKCISPSDVSNTVVCYLMATREW